MVPEAAAIRAGGESRVGFQGTGDHPGALARRLPRLVSGQGFHGRTPCGQFFIADRHIDAARGYVDLDDVAIAHQGQGALVAASGDT